ncbi:hypothetical protein [Streptomyces sp. ET3-23]|uniref:hypothetical protein n=1 Tax=Streptomyces sp. ET3-23 TaxID=2885643 RepID=UPI0035B03823
MYFVLAMALFGECGYRGVWATGTPASWRAESRTSRQSSAKWQAVRDSRSSGNASCSSPPAAGHPASPRQQNHDRFHGNLGRATSPGRLRGELRGR